MAELGILDMLFASLFQCGEQTAWRNNGFRAGLQHGALTRPVET